MQDSIIQSEIDSLFNEPPIVKYEDLPLEASFISSYEFNLIIVLFAFSSLVIITLALLKWQKAIESDIFFLTLTLIIVVLAGLYLITAGFTGDLTSSLVALLGSIVGYIFGNKSQK